MQEEPSRYALTAFAIAQATMSARRGDFERAWGALATARNHIDRQRSLHKYSVDTFGNVIQLKERGCVDFAIRFSWLQERGDGSVSNQEPPQAVMLQALELAAVVDFASGKWAEANAKLDPAMLRTLRPSKSRTVLLAIVAAMAAFNGQTPELSDLIEADLRYTQERALWRRSIPLACWWAAHIWSTRPDEAARLVEPLRSHFRAVPDSTASNFPSLPSFMRPGAIKEISYGTSSTRATWNVRPGIPPTAFWLPESPCAACAIQDGTNS